MNLLSTTEAAIQRDKVSMLNIERNKRVSAVVGFRIEILMTWNSSGISEFCQILHQKICRRPISSIKHAIHMLMKA